MNRISQVRDLHSADCPFTYHRPPSLQISKDAFKNLFKLEELLLGQNAIHVVSNGLLSQLHNLKKLMLFSNNIKSLQKNAFFGLQSLKVLFLNNNLLMDFPEDIFQPLAPQLEKMYEDHYFR